MARGNQLQANLSKPVPEVSAHEAISITQGTIEDAFTVSFRRTIRVPEDGTTYDLPPNLGYFPLYNVSNFKTTLPESMARKGGTLCQSMREALWIELESKVPFAVKIYLGAINAISGEPLMETFATLMRRSERLKEQKTIQDYAVVDPADQGQLWLDGIAKEEGKAMQFVAVPSGAGYSIEAQIAQVEAVGGIQIIATPIKRGVVAWLTIQRLLSTDITISIHLNATIHELMTKIMKITDIPVEQFYLLFNGRRLEKNHLLSRFNVTKSSTINMVLNLQGGGLIMHPNVPSNGQMSIAAGGLIKQAILRDPHNSDAWDVKNTSVLSKYPTSQRQPLLPRHRHRPTPCPITAETYAEAGLPLFSLPEEPEGGLYGIFSDVKCIMQIDTEKGKKCLDKELKFPIVKLDKSGEVSFKSVNTLEMELKAMGFAHFE